MNVTDTEMEMRLLEQRLAGVEEELEDSRLSAGYARFYAPLALISAGLALMPLLRDVTDVDGHEHIREYGRLWDLMSDSALGIVGLTLMGALVVLLVLAAARVRNVLLPVGIAMISVLVVVLLVGLAGLGFAETELSNAGLALVAAAAAAGLVAAVHVVHLLARHRGDSA